MPLIRLLVLAVSALLALPALSAGVQVPYKRGAPAMNDLLGGVVDASFEIVANTPEQFTAQQAAEFARWKSVIETGKISAD